MLKKLLKSQIFIIVLVLSQMVFAQTKKMVIEYMDGTIVRSSVSTVKEITFEIETITETVTDIDGNVYNVVLIGNQYWMVENLRTTKYNDGTDIPKEEVNSVWAGLTTGAYCAYDNDDDLTVNSYASTYGYLYNWYAVNGIIVVDGEKEKEIAPVGWHVPTDEEWMILEMALGMSELEAKEWGNDRGSNEGSKLAGGADLWYEDCVLEKYTGFGTSGFSGLPAGYRHEGRGIFSGINLYSYFWSATENMDAHNGRQSYFRTQQYSSPKISRYYDKIKSGYSVRCVKDN